MKKIQKKVSITGFIFLLGLFPCSLYGQSGSLQMKKPADPFKRNISTTPKFKEKGSLSSKHHKEEFERNFALLSREAQDVILDRCGDWNNDSVQWNSWLSHCIQQVPHSSQFAGIKKDLLDYNGWQRVFPEEDNPDVPQFVQNMQGIDRKQQRITHNYEASARSTFHKRSVRGDDFKQTSAETAKNILVRSEAVVFMEQTKDAPFLKDRKAFLTSYDCQNNSPHLISSIDKCYQNDVARRFPSDKTCMDKVGFKKCRPFLKGGCQEKDVLALSSELSQEDKNGMAYICWKAAMQGAQCCMNPDQCPTDGAFSKITSQLQ
ncbi:MAG: hypothetical protein OXB86_04480, partial [Bdellovibrionales bacterium]|nr:hypothetical protein [Bdellovibrionales bacterium]